MTPPVNTVYRGNTSRQLTQTDSLPQRESLMMMRLIKITICFAALLACCRSRSNVAAFCSDTYDNFAAEQGSGFFNGYDCLTSTSMGMWADVAGGAFDTLTVFIDYYNGSQLVIYFHGNESQKGFILFPIINGTYVYPVVWCDDGLGDSTVCEAQKVNWTIADCQPCPTGTLRQYGECSADTPATDTVCLSICPPGPGSIRSDSTSSECQLCSPGYYQNATNQTECFPCQPGTYGSGFGSTECIPCPLESFGSNSGEYRETCSGLCPYGTYGNSSGLAECAQCSLASTEEVSCGFCPAGTYSQGDIVDLAGNCTSCPNYELVRSSGRDGLTNIDQCGSFQTSGFWQRAKIGSRPKSSLSQGIDLDERSQEVLLAMQMGTSFETRSEQGWAAISPSHSVNFSAAEEVFPNGISYSSFNLSEAATNGIYAAVNFSLFDNTQACPLTCEALPGTKYGWRWIHTVFNITEIVLLVETCETYCIYNSADAPQCPPGRCGSNTNCAICLSGSFADQEVDRIASTSMPPTAPPNSAAPDSAAPNATAPNSAAPNSSAPNSAATNPTAPTSAVPQSAANTPTAPTNEKGSAGVSTGAAVGIALGSIVAVIAIGAAARRWFIGRSDHGEQNEVVGSTSPPLIATLVEPVPLDRSVLVAEVFEPGSHTYSAVAVSDGGPDYKDQVRSGPRIHTPTTSTGETSDGGPDYKDQMRTAMGDPAHTAAANAEVSEGGPDYKDQAQDAKPAAKGERKSG